MRKIIIVLSFIFAVATPSYAVSMLDNMVCKPVLLRYSNRTILVNRITGEAKYVMTNGKYIPLKGGFKKKCQEMYDAQKKLK